jgi:hypothetical protein
MGCSWRRAASTFLPYVLTEFAGVTNRHQPLQRMRIDPRYEGHDTLLVVDCAATLYVH